ncbi:MAG: ABC transporter ATP-binding protein [Dehalococcoidia bacterium]
MSLEFDAAFNLGAFHYEAALEAGGEVVVLFGHSGAGKSVTLQAVAGLLRPARGRIVIDGRVVFDADAGTDVPPQQRDVGYVVQQLALFPHMTVRQNVEFGARGDRGARRRRATQALASLGLAGYEERMPRTLSGGQQQRVALARALARDVRLLLLDEPFSALDDTLRRGLRAELLRLRSELGLTVLFVTHDLREAHLLADRLAVFDEGRVLQFGARDEVFRRPATRRVAELTGVANIMRGTVLARREDCVEVDVGGLRLRCGSGLDAAPATGAPVDVAIRAERVVLRRAAAEDIAAPNLVAATVVEEHAYGASHTLLFRVTDGALDGALTLEADLASRPYEVLGVASQREWTLELPAADLHVMRAER